MLPVPDLSEPPFLPDKDIDASRHDSAVWVGLRCADL